MSLFQEDVDNIKKAIVFFNTLPQDVKAKIVADLQFVNSNNQLLENLMPLLGAVQNDIADYDPTTLSQKLFEYGMEQVFAILLIDIMTKQGTTTEYEISVLAKINDTLFSTMFPELMNDLWIHQMILSDIAQKHQLSDQIVGIVVSLSRKLLTGLARRTFSEQKIRALCESKGLSNIKIEVLLNVLKIHSKSWFDNLVFTNTQDAFFEINKMKQQNDVILTTLKEILTILKQYQKPPDSSHYQ